MRVHKYVLSPQRYFTSCLPASGLDALVARAPLTELAATLMADRPCRRAALAGLAGEAAAGLLAAGLLREEAGQLRLAELQLVSVQGIALFIDAAPLRAGAPIYPVPGPGLSSPLLAHHIDVDRIPRGAAALDLATGPGMLALFLARHAGRVVATDPSPERLQLAELNRALARRDALELRAETTAATLARGERFAVVTCNPWVAPFPAGLAGPVYAAEAGADGLGPLREVVAALGDLLLPGGTAYLTADLPGDDGKPFFLTDLERAAAEQGLVADVYLEDRVDHRLNHGPLRGLANLVAFEQGCDRHQAFERVKDHHLGTLGATCRYQAVMVLARRGGAGSRMRVLNRFQGA